MDFYYPSLSMRKMLVVRARKTFWLLAIFTSFCLIILNLLFSPRQQSSLLDEENGVFLGESMDYTGPALPKVPDPVTGVQIVGLGDLPAIKPPGCVRTKPILGGSNPELCPLSNSMMILIFFLMTDNPWPTLTK